VLPIIPLSISTSCTSNQPSSSLNSSVSTTPTRNAMGALLPWKLSPPISVHGTWRSKPLSTISNWRFRRSQNTGTICSPAEVPSDHTHCIFHKIIWNMDSALLDAFQS
jgi:hypothetical protein